MNKKPRGSGNNQSFRVQRLATLWWRSSPRDKYAAEGTTPERKLPVVEDRMVRSG